MLTDVGPCLHDEGVAYRVWALGRKKVVAHIEKPDGDKYTLALEEAKNSGYFYGVDPNGKAGDLYQFSIDGGSPIPDFISHFQPRGLLGPSMVVDASRYSWKATNWNRPAWNGHVIYECHIGTFTKTGTFRAAIEKLDYIVSLGITALEVMPVAEFPGERNWGYDGVLLFSPSHSYGTPDDFRALIDACHLRGLAVILDIVYNHLGPEGNFSHQYSDFFFHLGQGQPVGPKLQSRRARIPNRCARSCARTPATGSMSFASTAFAWTRLTRFTTSRRSISSRRLRRSSICGAASSSPRMIATTAPSSSRETVKAGASMRLGRTISITRCA